jgi:phosphoserine phosphatase RsbU/P
MHGTPHSDRRNRGESIATLGTEDDQIDPAVLHSSLELRPVCVKVEGKMLVRQLPGRSDQTDSAHPIRTRAAAAHPAFAPPFLSGPVLLLRLFLALVIFVLAASMIRAQEPQADDHPHQPSVGMQVFGPKPRHPAPPKGEVPKSGETVFFDAEAIGSPVALDRNWRLGIDASSEPAKPDFDDSAWPERDAKQALAEVNESNADKANDDDKGPQDGHPHGAHDGSHHHPFAWFRIHIQLPANHGPLAVLVRLPVSRNTQISFGSQAIGMDLFANGKQITPEGPNGAAPEAFQQISRIYPIDIPADETSLTLAVRIPFVPFGLDAYTGFFANRTFYLGERSDLNSHLDLWRHAVIFERLPQIVDNGLRLILALFLLALFWTQRDHPEYLWLGLHLLMVVPLAYIDLIGSSAQMDKLLMAALVCQCLLISAYFYFEFLVSFLYLRKRWYIVGLRYSSPLLLTLSPLIIMVHSGRAENVALAISVLFCVLWVLSWGLFTALTLTIAAVKRNYEAALLLLPLLLSLVGLGELISTDSNTWMGSTMQSPLTMQAGPVPIHFSALADFAGVFVIILIIFVRFLRILRERERAASELAAARSVQELMIPREAPLTPGFQVDTVYTPATEVGGDFFHIQATPDGGLLVVIGDVAGHGLQAAMTVSMIMGALRRSPQSMPGEILAALNDVLGSSSGLTTCEAAYFAASGEVILASAGHPAPYLNSQEVAMPGGLPLGVVPHITYDEVRLYLHPGDRLLMISDGVAEARKPNGELFGFERVRNLSSQSAFFIADAAKDFGQEDDITVLTVRRLAQAMAA